MQSPNRYHRLELRTPQHPLQLQSKVNSATSIVWGRRRGRRWAIPELTMAGSLESSDIELRLGRRARTCAPLLDESITY